MQVMVSINGEDIVLTNENCQLFRFRRDPMVDHAYYEDEHRNFYMFDSPHLFAMLEECGVVMVVADTPSPRDQDAFARYAASRLDEELGSL